jgi:hypothetical protein
MGEENYPPKPQPTMTTFHTYADLLYVGGRLAQTVWAGVDAPQSVDATRRRDHDAVVLRVTDKHGRTVATGYAPGGIA